MKNFSSRYERLAPIQFPHWTGVRIMMLPFLLEDIESLPDSLRHWAGATKQLCNLSHIKAGVAYLTIDERIVAAGDSHRRGGLHVDGVGSDGMAGAWGGGGGGPWAKKGMLLASNPAGCRAYNQDFEGQPASNGECEHLRTQCGDGELLEPNVAYWCDGLCVHESLPFQQDTQRTLVRLSMPSDAPWYQGYTRNPKGIKPTGPILPQREFQNTAEVVLA